MKIALGVEYNGHEFHGWQAQENLPTIQGHLEIALSAIADEPIQVFCAGRTDAGVHATGQVIHFETQAKRQPTAWILGTNSHLPSAISVTWMQEVNDDFHARFSAVARRYCYVIYNHSSRSALLSKRATWFYRSLDADLMHTAGQYLLGEQDFTSYRSAQCESTTPMRNVHALQVKRHENYIFIEIQANAFLHHMVRNIVGVLMEIGTQAQKPHWTLEVLQAKDRRLAAQTAAADGLYLANVIYPAIYSFPKARLLML